MLTQKTEWKLESDDRKRKLIFDILESIENGKTDWEKLVDEYNMCNQCELSNGCNAGACIHPEKIT